MKTEITISKKVGRRIKDLRIKRGITQEKLGELSGIDPKHIQLLESNRPSNSRVDTIQYVANAFGLTISEFFTDDNFESESSKFENLVKTNISPGLLKANSSNLNRKKIFEDNLSYAVYDEHPVNRGHILIIPNRNFSSYFSALPEEKQSLWEMIEKAKKFLDREYKPDGYNIGFNEGEAAGESVPNFQIHIIPRYKNDTINHKSGMRRVIPDK